MKFDNGWTRREVLKGMAIASTTTLLSASSFSTHNSQTPHTIDLIAMPTLPTKVFTTERVGISRKTHEEHLKLWRGYANKTNEIRTALSKLTADTTPANQIYSEIRALKVDHTFAYCGYINHAVYFDTIGGQGGTPSGEIMTLIKKSFGSFESWQQDWKATGLAGRGWAFLGYDRQDKKLYNLIGDSQNTYPIWNTELILAMDVYEHAYYLDFQTARSRYIDAYMQVIDWIAVERRLLTVID